ncbi:hypothetical protein IGI04_031843 [Brassica rapa subsp. trilocularis]|uniref:Secreted protein n=1 Tax=Brassica rapa subsp. trilocularis TaxID=1813537 RepID=A0ABQ7LUQ9_BRACM|nr:hypothetical protein IGI04_031843 [Brassica rapa subsp. trilocularis]
MKKRNFFITCRLISASCAFDESGIVYYHARGGNSAVLFRSHLLFKDLHRYSLQMLVPLNWIHYVHTACHEITT